MTYVFTVGFVFLVWLAIVALNERARLLSADRFPSPALKYFGYAWLLFFLMLLAVLVTGSALAPARAGDLAKAPFYSLFTLHAILVMFLAGWWIAAGRPPMRDFLKLQPGRTGEAIMIGIAVGVGGWVITIAAALGVAMILQALGLMPQDVQPSPMVGFMAGMNWWKKVIIVLSAMTVEEFFFRSWLQTRVGVIASTALFALAHFTLGQPMLLIGITVISLIIGFTFYRTKNVLPGVVAHGVFDAIQLFVIIPLAFKITGM